MTAGMLSRSASRSSAERARGVRLLDAVPELGSGVPASELETARRLLVVPTMTVTDADVPGLRDCAAARRPFAIVVVQGIVLRETRLADRIASEVLGAGDVLITEEDQDPRASVKIAIDHRAQGTATVAVLDERFRTAARRWPGLHDALGVQLRRQAVRASRNLAMLHLPRADDRIRAVLVDLADRWGRMTPEGVLLELDLTHDLVGRLTGARRPTVSLALAELTEAGVLARRADRSWVLSPELFD